MAKTGETRKTKQPLNIDRLPSEVHDAILYLRNVKGKTWAEIEAKSAEKFAASWKSGGGGFINWDNLPEPVRKLFPGRKLPKSNLQRWWDIRVEQVQANVSRMAVQAREIGQVFAKAVGKNDKDAVVGTATNLLLGILAEDGSVGTKAAVASALTELAEVMEKGVTNKLRERVVAMTERKVAALEAQANAAKKKLEAESEKLKKKVAKGGITPEDMDRLRERVFGLPPRSKEKAAA